MAYVIDLGNQERLKILFAYPNKAKSTESLKETIEHFFHQTLKRDQLDVRGARASVRVEGPNCSLELEGPPELTESFQAYGARFPKLLEHGWEAFTQVVPRLMAEKRWDPNPTLDGPTPYRPWRFFLPFGMAMLHQRSLQFFHYPPIGLVELTRDYLKDPVPARYEELLIANGVPKSEVHLYETVVDAVPIAAGDDQGSKQQNTEWGLMPVPDFAAYQRAQVALLLNPTPKSTLFTVPIVVYGGNPKHIFQQLFLDGAKFKQSLAPEEDPCVKKAAAPKQAPVMRLGVATVEILPGKATPVLATTHPYAFYVRAQTIEALGCGHMKEENFQAARDQMVMDLVAARWHVKMVADPTQDPEGVLKECHDYWTDTQQADQVDALVRHQGSLYYPQDNPEDFKFKVPWDRAPVPEVKKKKAG